MNLVLFKMLDCTHSTCALKLFYIIIRMIALLVQTKLAKPKIGPSMLGQPKQENLLLFLKPVIMKGNGCKACQAGEKSAVGQNGVAFWG